MRPSRLNRTPPKQLSCFACKTSHSAEWNALSEAELAQLDQHKVTLAYRQGDVIYHQGNPCTGIYSIKSGAVAIRKTDDQGHTILLRMAHEGDTIGYTDFFGGQGFASSAEALDDATLCLIEGGTLQALMAGNPTLMLRFLVHISEDLNHAQKFILQQAYLSARARLAHLLLKFRERYATQGEDGAISITPPISRQDMADILGIRPETIARAFNALEADGALTFKGRTVIIKNLDNLFNEIEAE